jgi:hypothetical protein
MDEIHEEVAKFTKMMRLARAAGMPDGTEDVMLWLMRHGLAIKIPDGWMFKQRALDGTVTWLSIADSLLEDHDLITHHGEHKGDKP